MGKYPVIIIDENENSCDIAKAYLQEFGYNNIQSFINFEDSIEQIKKLETTPIVILNFSDVENIETIKQYTSKIIAITLDYNTDTIIKALRLNIKEILPKPIIKDELKRALSIVECANYNEGKTSQIISVYSNKGGIGKTTIATNIAYELSRTTSNKVALIDLNLQLGDVATFLNINPPFDIAFLVNQLTNKKSENIQNAFEKYKDTNLYIISDPNYIEQASSITAQQIEIMFNALKQIFPYIVVDLSANIEANTLKILDCSDLILFTTIVNLPAIRNCQRCLNLFKSRLYDNDKVKIVLNRYMENENITIEDIENTLGEKIYWKFPNNYFSIMEAINRGTTVNEVNSNSNIANSFRDCAMKITDDIAQKTIAKYKI